MKGIYCLIIKIQKNVSIIIGRLGKIKFEKGYYTYVGSAQNNLEKRIERHLRKNKKKFWHIDYLLENPNVEIKEVLSKKASKTKECEMARKIRSFGVPVKNFGCSDCNCESHLFKINDIKQLKSLFII
ncbi:MAG: GIY-YIG nuclease family protein [Candidatus Aenigmarchaeota archaeon]|nr:GIY-YIG nuclease family protein [Candidatus Aenigmarchaeota archaeon]